MLSLRVRSESREPGVHHSAIRLLNHGFRVPLLRGGPGMTECESVIINAIWYDCMLRHDHRGEHRRGQGQALCAHRNELREIIQKVGFEELPITLAVGEAAARLSLEFHDPWDRILAAQAIESASRMIAKDAHIAKFGVQTVW